MAPQLKSAFVLWAIYAVLPEQRLAQQVVLQTFGYGRYQTLSWLILPAIAPVLGAVMLAVLAQVALGRGRGDRSRARQPAHPGTCWPGSG